MLLVDVKPGYWRVALGSKEEKLGFTPACVGIKYLGWLDVNKYNASLGLGLGISVRKDVPKVDLEIASFYAVVNAYVQGGILATVQYKPFQVLEAGLWIEFSNIMHQTCIANKVVCFNGAIEVD